MTRELSEKVEIVTNKKVSEYNVAPKKSSENKIKEKEKVSPQSSAILEYKCDQCSCTFKKSITLQKNKSTRHGKSLNELGERQLGFVFDVIPVILRLRTLVSAVKMMMPFWQNMMTMETLLGEAYSGPKGLYSSLLH